MEKDLLELDIQNEKGYKFSKGLQNGTLIKIFQLFSMYEAIVKPNKNGGKGVKKHVQILLTNQEFEDIKKNIKISNKEGFVFPKRYLKPIKGSVTSYPFQKNKEYKREGWTFKNLEDVKAFLGIFKNKKPKTRIIWLRDTHKKYHCGEISSTKYEKLKEEGKLNSFYAKKFPSKDADVEECYLVVGKKQGRVGNFHITFTKYPNLLGVFLQLSFYFETTINEIPQYPCGEMIEVELKEEEEEYTVDNHPFSQEYNMD